MEQLFIANTLLKKISSIYPLITPVVLNDLSLFQQFFQKEPHSYGNSWTYVTQGVYGIGPNNLGYKYYDGTNLSMVCIYPKLDKPDQLVFYWIRPIGPSVVTIIIKMASDILQQYNIPTYVKKIFPEQHSQLKLYGFYDIDAFPWHPYAPSEDDTLPEQILDKKNTLSLAETLNRKNHLRKSFVRTKQIHMQKDVTFSSDCFEKIAWDITKSFFQSNVINHKRKFLSDESDYYNMIFANSGNTKIIKTYAMIQMIPLGYYIAEQIDDQYSCLYGLIVLRDKIKFLSDLMMLEVLKQLPTPYLNLGGSEDHGIHAFKKKFFPTKERKMKWATNYQGLSGSVFHT